MRRWLTVLTMLLLAAAPAGAADNVGPTTALNAADVKACVQLSNQQGAVFHLDAGTFEGTIVPRASYDGGASLVAGAVFVSPGGVPALSSIHTSPNSATDLGILVPTGATTACVLVSAHTSGTASGHVRGTLSQVSGMWGTDGSNPRIPKVRADAADSADYGIVVRCVSGCSGSGGTSMTDDAAFTVGTTAFTPIGGTYKSTLDAVDDNDGGAFAMTQKRALHTACYTPNGDSCDDDTNDARRVTLVTTATVGGQSATATTLPYPNGAGNLAAFIRPTTATTTLWITGESSEHIYVTSMLLHASGTQGVLVVSGTGATCGTGTETVLGEVELSTTNGTGFTLGNGNGMVLRTKDAGDSLCITTDSATALNALATYAIY